MWKRFKLYIPFYRTFFRSRSLTYLTHKVKIGTEKYTLRKVKNEDIKALLAVEREVYQGEVPWNRTAFLMEINGYVPHLYLLLEWQEQVVAFIGCRIKNEDGHITNVAVHPAYQNKGIGKLLLEEIFAVCRQNKCRTMSLEVRKSNMDAQRLYRRLGFVSNAVKKKYYQPDLEDAIEMILDLKES